jgi:hypothetical protein
MTDEVPSQGQIRCLLHLREGFLDLVLPEIQLAGGGSGPHVGSRKGL